MKILLTNRDPDDWWNSHVAMFRLGSQFEQTLTDDERAWIPESGFGRMQAALGTIVWAAFDGRVDDREHCLRVFLGADVPDEPFLLVNAGDNLLVNIRTAMEMARARRPEPVWR